MRKYILSIGVWSLFFVVNVSGQDCFCQKAMCGNMNVGLTTDGSIVACEGDSIFLINSSDNFDHYIIHWGDGSVDTTDSYNLPAHRYNIDSLEPPPACNDTEYNFVICFSGFTECSSGKSCHWMSTGITVLIGPEANWTFNNLPCIGNSLSFIDQSCHTTDETIYKWSFGDGTFSDEQYPSHTYNSPNVYTVSFTVSDSCGSDTETHTIEVVDFPVASIDLSGTGGGTGCAPLTQLISSNSNQWVDNLEWTISPDSNGGNWFLTDTNATLGDAEFEVQFNTPGVYTLTLEYSNACATVEIE